MLLQNVVPKWASVDPWGLSKSSPHTVKNYVAGKWVDSKTLKTIVDPLNGEEIIKISDTKDPAELDPFIKSIAKCSKSGLHNPLKNPERYQIYGDVCFKIAAELRKPEVLTYFCKLLQRVIPKSHAQVEGEIVVTRRFFENFAGDVPRMVMRSFNQPGDHQGQYSTGYRFPFGPVGLITPFNFPLEISALQAFGALIAGNKLLFKGDQRVNIVMEQFYRMAFECGLPREDIDILNCGGEATEYVLKKAPLKNLLFTGSAKIAEHLTQVMKGRIKLEDAGFGRLNWGLFFMNINNKYKLILN